MEQHLDIRRYIRFISMIRRFEWLVQPPFNFLQKIFFPFHTIYGRKSYLFEAMKLIGRSSVEDLNYYKQELLDDELLKKNYVKAIDDGRMAKKYNTYEERINNNEANVVHYYALIRELKPRFVVETGTASGSMTSWILSALHENGNSGELISIDIPPVKGKLGMGMTIDNKDVGFLIPYEYRRRWRYMIGDAKIVLPKLLGNLEVDVFIHDSLHTRTHMLFEYNVARALMKPGSVIMSDDILWNKAFFSFVESHKLTSITCISNPNLGLTVNRFDIFEKNLGTGVIKM